MTQRESLTIAMAQYSQIPLEAPFSEFADSVRSIAETRSAQGNRPDLVVFPEMHMFGPRLASRSTADDGMQRLQDATTDFHDDFTKRLADLARELRLWLIPGTVPERNPTGSVYNTAPVFSPHGSLIATYRKVCPWRPFETYTPGSGFTVFDIPDKGRVGLTICYDAWFPEISRQVAWMGAELIVNLVRTTTPDRSQELVLARANAIVNQTFMASVNAAEPQGVGNSILVDPEGTELRTMQGDGEQLHVTSLDLGRADEVRTVGTAGSNKVWEQFRPGDDPIALPLYAGAIDPRRWHPSNSTAPRRADDQQQHTHAL